jgi:dinuclear metal center YbgI/SA1388 family protein
MTTIADLITWLEHIAPPRLAEEWDNIGLLSGDPAASCERVMTCLTITKDTADEAVAGGAQLVVSHHPVLLRGVKALRADRPETAGLWRLTRGGVAVYSAHTAFDNAKGGINSSLAKRFGLTEVEPLAPGEGEPQHKVMVFCPREEREAVMQAAFKAGAGHIGAYSECSFSTSGIGTFFGDETTHPAVGQKGRRESVREWRVELLCTATDLGNVLAAIRAAHPYEEPAIDVYPLRVAPVGFGAGRIGRLAQPESLAALADRVARELRCPAVQVVGEAARTIRRLAIACGAGDSFVAEAARRGADAMLTGEARYHRAVEAEALGLALVLPGHHATERPGVENLSARLAAEFPSLHVWASRSERDPLRWVAGSMAE